MRLRVHGQFKTPAKSVKKTKLDFSRTDRVGRLASAFMVLGFLLLLPALFSGESLQIEFHGAICMSSR
ncbi:hypothetical protein EMGBS2_00110 [Actinomycetota bacterium]|nr:hypothetical protein EMGBS2_00110 [Actinomycetota bacterium]